MPIPDDGEPTSAADRERLAARSTDELRERSEARRRGQPVLILRPPDDAQRIVPLDAPAGRMTIGRRPDNDIPLPWDPNTSRVHAELQRLGGEWVILDDGLSRNGTLVNGRRLTHRHRLRDGDVIAIGLTALLYRSPLDAIASTAAGPAPAELPRLTDVQRRVLVALARPCRDPDERRAPATNLEIGEELHLSAEAVKTHLRTLFTKFAVADLARNEKRARLVAEAFRRGVIEPAEL